MISFLLVHDAFLQRVILYQWLEDSLKLGEKLS